MLDSIYVPHRGVRLGLASRGDRFIARVVDNVLMLVPILLCALGGLGVGANGGEYAAYVLLGVGGLLSLAAWAANMRLLVTTGQTIGKRLLSLEVVGLADGGRVDFVKAVMLREVVFFFVRFVPGGGLAAVADSLWIFSADRRCLHDHLAKTHVVSITSIMGDDVPAIVDVFR